MSRAKRDAERREEYKLNDPFGFRVNEMAHGILSRTRYKIHTAKNKSYRERGVECRIGTNKAEIRETLTKHFAHDIRRLMARGELPTVDRIDSHGHYELGNLRIVSLEVNRQDNAGNNPRPVIVTDPSGDEQYFESVSAASKTLGIKRDTIYANAERGTTSQRGFRFELERV